MNPYFVKLSNGSYLNLSQVTRVYQATKGNGVTEDSIHVWDAGDRTATFVGKDREAILAALDKLSSIVSE